MVRLQRSSDEICGLVAAAVASSAIGCGRPAFDVERYSLDVRRQAIPIMLSDTKVRDPGREITAWGYYSHLYASSGNGGSRSEQTWTAFSPSEQLRFKIDSRDRFVQIRAIDFFASDWFLVATSREARKLEIEAEAVK